MTPPTDDRGEPPDDEIAAQLDALETTLTDLRGELRADDRRGPPQPPRLGELLRFTEQYTIPTLIAILEATIRSLELLRRTLRLADPTRAAREEQAAARSRLDEVGSEAGRQLADALTELRTALSETDLPEDGEARDLITDARELTGEIESRLRDAETTVSDHRETERNGTGAQTPTDTADGGVLIDVSDAATTASGESADYDSDHTSDTGPEVDVDAELESIKAELSDTPQPHPEQPDAAAAETDKSIEQTDDASTDETNGGDTDETDSGDTDKTNGGDTDG